MLPIYSGPKSTAGASAVQALAGQPGTLMRGGAFWNPATSGAGSISFDGGNTYTLDFEAGLFGPVPLPAGMYAQSIWVKRSGATDLAGFKIVLYPADAAS